MLVSKLGLVTRLVATVGDVVTEQLAVPTLAWVVTRESDAELGVQLEASDSNDGFLTRLVRFTRSAVAVLAVAIVTSVSHIDFVVLVGATPPVVLYRSNRSAT